MTTAEDCPQRIFPSLTSYVNSGVAVVCRELLIRPDVQRVRDSDYFELCTWLVPIVGVQWVE